MKSMLNLYIYFFIIGSFTIEQSLAVDISSDYYWREYGGIIPSDAIPGGTEKSGKRSYIGQIYSKFGLFPATIYQGSKIATATGGGLTITAEDYVKILCSRNHDRYSWVPTRNDEMHLLTDVHLVIGGTAAGFLLNIGRVRHGMETVIGKVFAHVTPYPGLHIPDNGTQATYQSYEILTYSNKYYENSTRICVYNINLYL